MKSLSTSTRIYFGLAAFLIFVKVVFLLFPTAFPGADQEGAFYWTTIFVIGLAGYAGLVLSRRTGFPDVWDARVSNRQRFLIPTLIGLVYGLETVLRDLPNPSPVHLKLPLSVLFYTYGAVLLEIMLRLFAVTFLTWLVSNVLLRGRWQTPAFWVAAVVAALYEPLPSMREELGGAAAVAVPSVIIKWATEPLFIANLVAAYLYRKYGFLAPLVMRLSFYLVWHIIYGGLLAA
jgi:hypothetical protein